MLRRVMMAGGTPPTSGPYWNPADCHPSVVLSSGNAVATRNSDTAAWRCVRSVTSHNSGKWYAECENLANGSVNGSLTFGLADQEMALTLKPGSNTGSWGAQANDANVKNTFWNNIPTSRPGPPIGVGGVVCIAVDFGGGEIPGRIWFGDSESGWYAGDPAAGTGAQYTFAANTTRKLILGLFSNPQSCRLRNQPGENLLTIPSGYSMWG